MPEEPEMLGSTIGVVTVDDQEAFLRSARAVIETTPGFVLLGEAPSGEEALALVARLSPDLVLVDVRMPGIDGFETARRLRSTHPATTVILLSSDEVADSMCDACGANAFVPKRELSRARLRRIWDEHGPATPGASEA